MSTAVSAENDTAVNDDRYRRIARISRPLRFLCGTGIVATVLFLVMVLAFAWFIQTGERDASWVLTRLSAGEKLVLNRDELGTLTVRPIDKALFVLASAWMPLVTLFCLVQSRRVLEDFRRALVFTDRNVRRVRTIGWTLLGAWLARQVFLLGALALGGTDVLPDAVSLAPDLVPSDLAIVGLVFLAAWILDIGRSFDVERRLTI